MQEFLEQKGLVQNEVRVDPPLAEFEAEIAKYRAIQNEILVRGLTHAASPGHIGDPRSP